jgi:hypothetical protein
VVFWTGEQILNWYQRSARKPAQKSVKAKRRR